MSGIDFWVFVFFLIIVFQSQYIRKQLTFIYPPYMLQPCFNCFLVPGVFLLILLDFLHRQSCPLVPSTVHFFLHNLYMIYFILLSCCIN